ERIENILSNGFTEEDFSHGEYGIGLYFSQYPSKAAQFSTLGKILYAEVAIGNTQTVVKKDRTRHRPDTGYDSILTPGRLFSNSRGDDKTNHLCQEYVIFNAQQVLPLYLIEYTCSEDST
ncbi:unnamed protein product, partial [Owenia fusiformis]